MATLDYSGLICLILSAITCGVAFFAPFWMRFKHDNLNQGLWGLCPQDKACLWFYEDDYGLQRSWPVWYKGAQAMYTLGYVLLVILTVICVFHISCHCKKKSIHLPKILATLVLIADGLMIIGMVVYAGMSYRQNDYKTSVNSSISVLSWAYYVAVAGIHLTGLAGILLLIHGFRHAKAYAGYKDRLDRRDI